MDEVLKTYKGFKKDMTCRGFKYEEGKEYETGNAKICEEGFHACEKPLDVFIYYQPSESIYHEVEQSGILSRSQNDDSKVASSKIKIGKKIGISGLVKAQIDFVFEKTKKCKNNETSGEGSIAATSGNWSGAVASGSRSSAVASGEESNAATSGSRSIAATSGNWSGAVASGSMSIAATSGNWSSAVASGSMSSAVASGEESNAATSGSRSSAVASGDWSGAVASGYKSNAATSGNGSSAVASGEESSAATSNRNGIALACGKNAKAKGVIGAHIVLTEWNDNADELLTVKLIKIDGEKYKPDVWYKIEDGKIVEVEGE